MRKAKHRKMSKKYRKMAINRKADVPKKILRIAACLAALVLIGTGAFFALRHFIPQLPKGDTSQAPSAIESSSALSVSSEEPAPPSSKTPEPVSITILGTGDNLIHSTIYKQAYQRTGGKGYDFKPVYANIKSYVQDADIAVVNQETILAGKIAEPSNYPLFNSPTEVGDALVDMGVDVVNHANNHVLDKGVKGIQAAMDYWKTQSSVTVIGVYQGEEDMENIRIVEAKGIKTAHIGVAESTNGIAMPSNSPFKLLMTSDREKIEKVIKKAKSMADVVVISAHWGNEDTFTVTDGQKKLAQDMVDWGADIIFGNHPHILQELTVLTRADGTKCPVIYAMGNMVSAQNAAHNMVGGMLSVTMTKDFSTNKTTFTDMKFRPIVTHYDYGYLNNRIYPLSQYTAELAAKHGVKQFDNSFNLNTINNIINKAIPKEYLVED